MDSGEAHVSINQNKGHNDPKGYEETASHAKGYVSQAAFRVLRADPMFHFGAGEPAGKAVSVSNLVLSERVGTLSDVIA